jgi:hypothetical protein
VRWKWTLTSSCKRSTAVDRCEWCLFVSGRGHVTVVVMVVVVVVVVMVVVAAAAVVVVTAAVVVGAVGSGGGAAPTAGSAGSGPLPTPKASARRLICGTSPVPTNHHRSRRCPSNVSGCCCSRAPTPLLPTRSRRRDELVSQYEDAAVKRLRDQRVTSSVSKTWFDEDSSNICCSRRSDVSGKELCHVSLASACRTDFGCVPIARSPRWSGWRRASAWVAGVVVAQSPADFASRVPRGFLRDAWVVGLADRDVRWARPHLTC